MKKCGLILIFLCLSYVLIAQSDGYFIELVKKGEYRINSIDVNKDNTKLLFGAENKNVFIYDLGSKKVVYSKEAHYQPVVKVLFSEVENKFYSIGDRSIRIWNVGGEKPEKIYTGTHTNITSFDLTPDEKHLVASSYDKKFRYWNATELKAIKTVETNHTKSIIAVALSTDSKLIATGSLDTSIELWDTSGVRKHLLLAHSRPVSCLKFINENKYILSASHDGNIRLWDIETGNPLIIYLGHNKPISSIKLSPCGKYLLVASFDNTISLFNIKTGDRIHKYVYHQSPVLDVVWKPKGNGFYSCDKEGNVVEWAVTNKVFVDYYFNKEMDAELQESKLLLPRKKGESKDNYKSRLERVKKLKNKLQEQYYQKYMELEKTFKIN